MKIGSLWATSPPDAGTARLSGGAVPGQPLGLENDL